MLLLLGSIIALFFSLPLLSLTLFYAFLHYDLDNSLSRYIFRWLFFVQLFFFPFWFFVYAIFLHYLSQAWTWTWIVLLIFPEMLLYWIMALDNMAAQMCMFALNLAAALASVTLMFLEFELSWILLVYCISTLLSFSWFAHSCLFKSFSLTLLAVPHVLYALLNVLNLALGHVELDPLYYILVYFFSTLAQWSLFFLYPILTGINIYEANNPQANSGVGRIYWPWTFKVLDIVGARSFLPLDQVPSPTIPSSAAYMRGAENDDEEEPLIGPSEKAAIMDEAETRTIHPDCQPIDHSVQGKNYGDLSVSGNLDYQMPILTLSSSPPSLFHDTKGLPSSPNKLDELGLRVFKSTKKTAQASLNGPDFAKASKMEPHQGNVMLKVTQNRASDEQFSRTSHKDQHEEVQGPGLGKGHDRQTAIIRPVNGCGSITESSGNSILQTILTLLSRWILSQTPRTDWRNYLQSKRASQRQFRCYLESSPNPSMLTSFSMSDDNIYELP